MDPLTVNVHSCSIPTPTALPSGRLNDCRFKVYGEGKRVGIWTHMRALVVRLVIAQSGDSVGDGDDGAVGDLCG